MSLRSLRSLRLKCAALCILLLAGPRGSSAAESAIAVLDRAPTLTASSDRPLVRWTETSTTPRPLTINFLRIDLQSPEYVVFAIVADDPDGKGPAEAALTKPETLFEKSQALAAVNANAFQALPNALGLRDSNWFESKPVDIVGLAASNGAIRSKVYPPRQSFWIDPAGKPHIGDPGEGDRIRQGISDWSSPLLKRGKIAAKSGGPLHPRTLLGLDASRRWLLFCVVDGRQPGYSEGMSLHESADLMKRHGCRDAINLDGGGSSIMLAADPATGKPSTLNRPSAGASRPIPVMIGVRRRSEGG